MPKLGVGTPTGAVHGAASASGANAAAAAIAATTIDRLNVFIAPWVRSSATAQCRYAHTYVAAGVLRDGATSLPARAAPCRGASARAFRRGLHLPGESVAW